MKSLNNNIAVFVLCFFLFIPSFFYSQNSNVISYSGAPQSGSSQTNKETAPAFILQGAVKLKGRPVNGVVLTLTKDGKQVAKIITPKNGLYYFQLKRSMTDPQSEYKLIILKDGVASGVLRVNTYTPKEKFTAVPYMFNLDIALSPPNNAGNIEKKDFGRIKWLSERSVFDFDKDYIPVIEKDTKVVDSIKLAEKIKEDNELKRQADSIATVMAADIKAENLKRKAAKEAAEKALESKDVAKQTDNKTSNKDASKSTTGKELSMATKSATINKSQSASESVKATASGSNEKIKPRQQNNSTQQNNSAQQNNLADVVKQNKTSQQKNLANADSAVINTGQKDLFFLTGVPMEKFKRDLPLGDAYSRDNDSYDANEAFVSNSERNRLLAAKQKYERKKAENFAKKQETNNTLTSLMDVVEEYEKTKGK